MCRRPVLRASRRRSGRKAIWCHEPHHKRPMDTNLGSIAGLTSLTDLSLIGNQLITLSLPAGLTSLIALYLGDNQLRPDPFVWQSGWPDISNPSNTEFEFAALANNRHQSAPHIRSV